MTGQRRALIVANDHYDEPGLRNLSAPLADAEALSRVLGDPLIGDFEVRVVRNQPAHLIQSEIDDLFSESLPDDLIVLHFSGHGLKSDAGELFFAASNTRPDRLGSTSVPADFVQRCMRDSPAQRVVLLLDCCYGGAFAQGLAVRAAGDAHVMDSFPPEAPGAGRGRAIITSSSALEYAFEGSQLADDSHPQPSVFTTALTNGLATGEADRDHDGWVGLRELYDYVYTKVRQANRHQTPSCQLSLQGELYLARSARQDVAVGSAPVDAAPDSEPWPSAAGGLAALAQSTAPRSAAVQPPSADSAQAPPNLLGVHKEPPPGSEGSLPKGRRNPGSSHILWALTPTLSLGLLLPVPIFQAARHLDGPVLWISTFCYSILWVTLLTVIIVQGSLGHLEASLAASAWLQGSALLASGQALRARRRLFASAELA
jgi:uncharacterized caspase-like protein